MLHNDLLCESQANSLSAVYYSKDLAQWVQGEVSSPASINHQIAIKQCLAKTDSTKLKLKLKKAQCFL